MPTRATPISSPSGRSHAAAWSAGPFPVDGSATGSIDADCDASGVTCVVGADTVVSAATVGPATGGSDTRTLGGVSVTSGPGLVAEGGVDTTRGGAVGGMTTVGGVTGTVTGMASTIGRPVGVSRLGGIGVVP
jgi:hypothetical protein